jgi:hypothetical protein
VASTDTPSAVAAPTGAAVHDSYDVLILDVVRTFHYDSLDRRDPGPALAELRTMARAARRSRAPRTFPA